MIRWRGQMASRQERIRRRGQMASRQERIRWRGQMARREERIGRMEFSEDRIEKFKRY
jgi:hypothetical protein